ncbi:hypothetical protein QZH41_016280 [Actinostola sp. cb2023]|nr:hypothetical protein QZH41_016280 [Actinostola sp. cb2023]
MDPSLCLVVLVSRKAKDPSFSISTAPHHPKWWFRYVDDSHVGITRTHVDEFHAHLNSVNPNIQFTVEIEKDGSLAFLDTKTTRQSDGSISVAVYRKPTHTDRYLDFNSHHHSGHKRAVAKTLLYRAHNIPSTPRERSSEEKHVFKALHANGYPTHFLQNYRPSKQQSNQQSPQQEQHERRGFVVLPYIQGISEKITRTLNKFNIRVVHKPVHTISAILKKPKDRGDRDATTDVIYRIGCKDCEKCYYIGQTSRALKTRIKEHIKAVFTLDRNSLLAKHHIETGHQFNFEDARIIDREPQWGKRLFLEAWHSIQASYSFEDDQFHPLNNSYKCDGKWIEWYKKFHEASLKSTDPNRRFLVFYCRGHDGGCGGYGNRMVGLVSTFYLAVLLGRVFMLHWGGPEHLESFLLPNEIDWRYNESQFQGGESIRTYHWGSYRPGGYDKYKVFSQPNFLNWIKESDLNVVLDRQVEKLDTVWYYAERLWDNRLLKKRAKELGLPGIAANHPYAMIGCAMKFLFKKTKHLMKEFDKTRKILKHRERPYIGIHIRTSDHQWGSTNRYSYRTRAPKRVFLCAERVEKALQKKYPQFRNKPLTWVLAADNKKLKQWAQNEYPSNVVTSNINPRHLDLNGEDFQSVLRDLLMDQLLLLQCDYFLPTWDSTFSYMIIGMKPLSTKNFVFGENCVLNEKAVALVS